MTITDVALVARARGMATHLVSRQTLESLADAGDAAAFTQALTRLGGRLDPVREPGDVFATEDAIARIALRHLQTLRRWQERRPGVLDVLFAFEDRRSLRALIRGAVEGTPAELRIAGLMPTPGLPGTTLSQLARQPSPSDVVLLLAAAGHSDAQALLTFGHAARPDLFAVDVALLRGCAGRVTAIARQGDDALRFFVRSIIDLSNMQNALLLAADHRDVDVTPFFVSGGRWVSLSTFVKAAGAASADAAQGVLAAAAPAAPLASWLPIRDGDLEHLDRAFLVDMLKRLAREARLDPLGSAPILRAVLLVAAQSRDLRALAWGATLGTPPPVLKQRLVTPP
jgi:vacuolar-type H+-ATPase subunit C/Vma6